MSDRSANVSRNTVETKINVVLNLDGSGKSHFDTGIPFLEHMLEQIARHGSFDLEVTASGDLHIDDHHTVEDIGITLGQAFKEALADKQGIMRYGHAYVPLDDTPEVLAKKAKTIIKNLGYTEPPADRNYRIGYDRSYLEYAKLQKNPREALEKVRRGQPLVYSFHYRQSPKYLIPLRLSEGIWGDSGS